MGLHIAFLGSKLILLLILFRSKNILSLIIHIMVYSCDRVDGGHVVYVEVRTIQSIQVLVLDQTSHV